MRSADFHSAPAPLYPSASAAGACPDALGPGAAAGAYQQDIRHVLRPVPSLPTSAFTPCPLAYRRLALALSPSLSSPSAPSPSLCPLLSYCSPRLRSCGRNDKEQGCGYEPWPLTCSVLVPSMCAIRPNCTMRQRKRCRLPIALCPLHRIPRAPVAYDSTATTLRRLRSMCSSRRGRRSHLHFVLRPTTPCRGADFVA